MTGVTGKSARTICATAELEGTQIEHAITRGSACSQNRRRDGSRDVWLVSIIPSGLQGTDQRAAPKRGANH